MDISEKLDDLEIFYERRLKESRAELVMLPKGGITVSRLRKGYSRRISYTDPITKKYHRRKAKRKEVKLVSDLAYRRYLNKLIKEDGIELKAIKDYKKKHIPEPHGIIKTNCPEEYHRLISDRTVPSDNNLKRYQDMLDNKYIRSTRNLQKLIISTMSGIKVRSKSECIIADLLTREGLAFVYEPILIIDGQEYTPDFIIIDTMTGRAFMWEHLGLLDKQDYLEKSLMKIADFNKDGWHIGVNLILTGETRGNPFNAQKAKAALDRILLN